MYKTTRNQTAQMATYLEYMPTEHTHMLKKSTFAGNITVVSIYNDYLFGAIQHSVFIPNQQIFPALMDLMNSKLTGLKQLIIKLFIHSPCVYLLWHAPQ